MIALLLPLQKSPFYVLIVGGWSFSVYAIQLVFRNLGVILQNHWNVVLGTNPHTLQTMPFLVYETSDQIRLAIFRLVSMFDKPPLNLRPPQTLIAAAPWAPFHKAGLVREKSFLVLQRKVT